MATYFDEHNCIPLKEGETPNHALHMARLLIDFGLVSDLHSYFNEQPPPASSEAITNLEKVSVSEVRADSQCLICLELLISKGTLLRLPCSHLFHSDCILPWLGKTNSCPFCRFELPTDDRDYEEHKKRQKKKQAQEEQLAALHDSMFS